MHIRLLTGDKFLLKSGYETTEALCDISKAMSEEKLILVIVKEFLRENFHHRK